MQVRSFPVLALFAANAIALCVLGFYNTTHAAPLGTPPFADAVEQRGEMLQQLREIKDLLKEQNALLRGNAKSVSHEVPKR
jgi:hypothetical protein